MKETTEIAKEMMIEFLEKMGIYATTVEVTLTEKDLYIIITGDKKGILIGRHGRTLDSLQFLFNRMVGKRLGEGKRVYIDVDGYKAKRSDSLTKMAARLGERVKRVGKSLTIGPFNPYDRRIIHLALREDPDLETESLGEGEMKRIRLIPKSKTY